MKKVIKVRYFNKKYWKTYLRDCEK